MNQEQGDLEILSSDIDALIRINPLAREQLKNIVLQRQMAALQSLIAQNGDLSALTPAETEAH